MMAAQIKIFTKNEALHVIAEGEIAVHDQFPGGSTINFDNTTRGFSCGTNYHHSQQVNFEKFTYYSKALLTAIFSIQLVYTGHIPFNPHCMVSCSTMVAGSNSTSCGESSYGNINGIPIGTITATANGTMDQIVN